MSTFVVSFAEIDIGISSISYPGVPIPRDRPGNYTFSLTVQHTGTTNYDIVQFTKGSENFETFYFYADKEWTNTNRNLSFFQQLPAKLPSADAMMSLSKSSSKAISAIVTTTMNYTECYKVTHICFIVKSSHKATFYDSSTANNIRCFELGVKKDCEPGT